MDKLDRYQEEQENKRAFFAKPAPETIKNLNIRVNTYGEVIG